jgi:hypothetical protein
MTTKKIVVAATATAAAALAARARATTLRGFDWLVVAVSGEAGTNVSSRILAAFGT